MKRINFLLGLLMLCVVGAVVVTAYSTESHGDGKVEVYGVVAQRTEPFAEISITYDLGAGDQSATLHKSKARFETEHRRVVPGRSTEIYIRYAPITPGALANEHRCQLFVGGRPVMTSKWLTRISVDTCQWVV